MGSRSSTDIRLSIMSEIGYDERFYFVKQQVLHLSQEHGMSVEQISERTGIGVQNVQWIISEHKQ